MGTPMPSVHIPALVLLGAALHGAGIATWRICLVAVALWTLFVRQRSDQHPRPPPPVRTAPELQELLSQGTGMLLERYPSAAALLEDLDARTWLDATFRVIWAKHHPRFSAWLERKLEPVVA